MKAEEANRLWQVLVPQEGPGKALVVMLQSIMIFDDLRSRPVLFRPGRHQFESICANVSGPNNA